MWTFNPRSYRKPIPKLQISVHGMQPAIHRTFPSKEKFGSFRGIYNLEILCHLASQLLQIERVEDSWKVWSLILLG